MHYVEFPVPAPLAAHITRTWFLETPSLRRFEKILPMPFAHLIVNLSEPYRIYDPSGVPSIVPQAFVSGLQSEYLVIESPESIRHLGVEFTATGLAALVPSPAAATADRVLDAATLLDGIPGLIGRARATATGTDAGAALEHYLLALSPHALDPVVEAAVEIIQIDTERPIADVAANIGVSHAVLLGRFRRATGTTPKRHARVVRFHRFIDAVHASGGPPDWAELAVSAGYFDQPHVIREFRRFSGWTPTQYYALVARHGPDAAHFVPLDDLPTYARS